MQKDAPSIIQFSLIAKKKKMKQQLQFKSSKRRYKDKELNSACHGKLSTYSQAHSRYKRQRQVVDSDQASNVFMYLTE